ncbi:hypothetical protein [Halobellus ruber]|uniref:Uncharacterized protein n=1 Tax=Halobellus ruber TaxID=2761102 RepID=A0A7J9SIK4_9EURY|nr:hypothetical protein [Halobellus ruber]MBB6646558.1 hypothetical protein [Halobellus ruber]
MPSSDDRSFTERAADFLDSIGLEDLTEDYREENNAGDDRLADAFDPLPDALADVPEVHEVNKVNTHRDGDDILVPVVPVVLEDAGEPAMDTVWDVVGTILEAIHSVFKGFHVRHYDVQFAYADANEEDVVYRRITVQPTLVERYLTDPGYTLSDLRADVKAGDDGDDGVPPVYWQQFDAESMASSGAYAGGGGAAVASACAGASAGAAASCAGGAAGAGGAGGAGGC